MYHLDHKTQTQNRDRRFTLDTTLDQIAAWTGVRIYDLDVCAEELSHVCGNYYSLERNEDGLIMNWYGHVWCNPPWSELYLWTARSWVNWQNGLCDTITMLIPVRTEQPFWQKLIEPYRDQPGCPLRVKFLEKRQEFGSPNDPKKVKKGSPPFICCALHWSRSWSTLTTPQIPR